LDFIGAINDWDALNGGEREDSSLRPYLSAIRARWWLLVATAVVAAIGCAGLLSLRESEYDARARILASPIPPYDDALVDTGLLTASGDPTRDGQTHAAMLETDRAAAETGRHLGLSRAEVASSVSIEPLGESDVLGVTATTGDPDSARRLANEYSRVTLAIQADSARRLLRESIDRTVKRRDSVRYESSQWTNLAQKINRLEASYDRGVDPTLRLLEPATAAGSRVGLGAGPIAAAVLFAGLGFGAVLALVLESLSPRVRDADELARHSGLPVLASVPRIRRRALRGRMSLERLSPAERAPIEALREQVERRLDGGGAILVVSTAPNEGRTTVAAGLALALEAAGHSVTLLPVADGDADVIEEAREETDFVVIDTAPFSKSSDALALTGAVDATVVVTRAGHTRLSALRALCALLDRTGADAIGTVVMGGREPAQAPQPSRRPHDLSRT
jgi:capsular polysaccharide biosynthesis protein